MTPNSSRRYGWLESLLVLLFSPALVAQMQIGPQIRLDPGTGTLPSNETTMASTHFLPNEIVAA